MNRTFAGWIGIMLLGMGACGGSTTGEESASGLPADQELGDLSPDQARSLCEWYVAELGGDGASYECAGDVVVIDSSDFACDELPPDSCTATVLDVEACARQQHAAFESCNLGEEPSACARLGRLCGGEDDASSGGGDPVASCVPGQTVECTCADGSFGSQSCGAEGDGFGPCACASMDPECPSGETQACACADGSRGARTCGGGTFGECVCEPTTMPPLCAPGSTSPCRCPDGATGRANCDASGTLGPCTCAPPTGSCVPDFCPSDGAGAACCITPNGPCGVDYGSGCGPAMVGSCDPTFCPTAGPGTPCCVTGNGPCGMDSGSGCFAPTAGTCDPNFCPAAAEGVPCCVTANGPCGTDVGLGCQ